jgi:hypothetical protein
MPDVCQDSHLLFPAMTWLAAPQVKVMAAPGRASLAGKLAGLTMVSAARGLGITS